MNLLTAIAFDPSRLRSVEDWHALPADVRRRWWEWLVAQELWRRAARRGDPDPENLLYWSTKEREIDFVVPPDRLIEVKRGRARPSSFSWFPRTFRRPVLTAVNAHRFDADRIRGRTMEEFLLEDEPLDGPAGVP